MDSCSLQSSIPMPMICNQTGCIPNNKEGLQSPFPNLAEFCGPKRVEFKFSDLAPKRDPLLNIFFHPTHTLRVWNPNTPPEGPDLWGQLEAWYGLACKEPTYVGLMAKPAHEVFLEAVQRPQNGGYTLEAVPLQKVNIELLDHLPGTITKHLWPLHNDSGFYDAFAESYVGWEGKVFKNAIAYRSISHPAEFWEFCDRFDVTAEHFVENLRHGESPSKVETALLSKLIQKNITIFEFNDDGNLVSSTFFDAAPEKSVHSPITYVGCIKNDEGARYFPLVRKTGPKVDPPKGDINGMEKVSHKLNAGTINGMHFSPELNAIENQVQQPAIEF